MPATSPHVLIVGAGIVGASLAYELVRQRARVTLLANATQLTAVTANSFAWLTTVYGQAEAVVALR